MPGAVYEEGMTSENAQTPHLVVILTDAVNSADWPRVADVLVDNWSEILTSHRDLFASIMRAMPPEFVERNSRLVDTRAYAEFLPVSGPTRPTRYRAPASSPEALVDVLSALTGRSAGARMAGDHIGSVAAAVEAEAALADTTPEARASIAHLLADIRVQWAISHLLAADLATAFDLFTQVYDDAVTTGNGRMATEAAGNCALILALSGTTQGAKAWLRRMPLIDDPRDTVRDAGVIAAAFIAIDGLDRSEAEARARELEGTVEVEHWALRLLVDARIAALWHPDTTIALSALLGAVSAQPAASSRSGLNAGILALAEAELRMRAGDLVRAQAVVERARSTGGFPILDVTDARISALGGRRNRARMVLADVLSRDPLPRIAALARLVRSALVDTDEGAHADRAAVRDLVALTGYEAVRSVVDRASWEAASASLPDRSHDVVFTPVFPEERSELTPRERAVLRQVHAGATIARIAEKEHLSPHTIKKQLIGAYRKLGVDDRAGAVAAVNAAPWVLAE